MKRVIMTSMVSVIVLLQGCAVQQKVDDRSVGGLSRVGIMSNDDQLEDSFPDYMGLEQVGVYYLDPVTKGSRSSYLIRAEKAILSSVDYSEAKLNLSRALYLDPDNKTAALLMSQLVNDPVVFAQAKNFNQNSDVANYTVKKRDTIKGLSRKVYGSSNYYPFIMRLNHLADSKLFEGSVISLPKPEKSARKAIKPTRKVVKKKTITVVPVNTTVPEKPVTTPVAPVEKPSVVKIDQPAVVLSEPQADLSATSETLTTTPALEAKPLSTAEEAKAEVLAMPAVLEVKTNDQSVGQARAVKDAQNVEEVMSEKPESPAETMVEEVVDAEDENPLEKQALAANAAGQQIRAYRLLKQVPDRSAQGDTILNRLADSLVSKPYAKGLKYYQEQKLSLAIAEFNKVLAADPTHGQAGIYKARCQKLLDKLSNIE